jgi:frataxin-like iron-binding protein CyaY
LTDKLLKRGKVAPSAQDELDQDEDIDCDALENKMMVMLENERKTVKNWHKVLMRI